MTDSIAPLRAGRFTIEGLDGVYDGYTHGERWNGWAVPYFSLAEAHRIANDYAAQPPTPDGQTTAEYDPDRDLFRFYNPSSDEWDEWGSVEASGVTGHSQLALYPIGAMYWTWWEEDRQEGEG